MSAMIVGCGFTVPGSENMSWLEGHGYQASRGWFVHNAYMSFNGTLASFGYGDQSYSEAWSDSVGESGSWA